MCSGKNVKEFTREMFEKWFSVEEAVPSDFDICGNDPFVVKGNKLKNAPGELVSIAQYIDGKWEIHNNEGYYSDTGLYGFESDAVEYWMKI